MSTKKNPASKPHPLAGWDIISMRLFDTDHTAGNLVRIAEQNEWQNIGAIISLYETGQHALVVTDLSQKIKYVNDTFLTMTEYNNAELINKRVSFLQSSDERNRETNELISASLKAGQEAKGRVINYRKSGSLYHCDLHIIPIKNRQNKLVNFLAFEKEVA